MASKHSHEHQPADRQTIGADGPPLMRLSLFVALIGAALALGFAYNSATQDKGKLLIYSYLVGFGVFLTASLGAPIFVMLQHVTKAGWSVLVRRIAEGMARNIGLMAILFVPILALVWTGKGVPYKWSNPALTTEPAEPAHVAHAGPAHAAGTPEVDHHAAPAEPAVVVKPAAKTESVFDVIIHGKSRYLNPGFFTARIILYFVVWYFIAVFYYKQSVAQDSSGDIGHTLKMQRRSPLLIVTFALTVTMAAFDIFMSLDAHWYSTIFGVYIFAGSMVAFLSLFILAARWLQYRGILANSITPEHYHDMGKLLFAFTFFWGYIAFSQFMLQWYANVPEETGWWMRRGAMLSTEAGIGPVLGGWTFVLAALLVGHFLLPFAGMMNRTVKRTPTLLVLFALWMLLFHTVDLYWLVMPEMRQSSAPLRLPLQVSEIRAIYNDASVSSFACALGCTVAVGGLWVANLARRMGSVAIAPQKDPRLPESLSFHNI